MQNLSQDCGQRIRDLLVERPVSNLVNHTAEPNGHPSRRASEFGSICSTQAPSSREGPLKADVATYPLLLAERSCASGVFSYPPRPRRIP